MAIERKNTHILLKEAFRVEKSENGGDFSVLNIADFARHVRALLISRGAFRGEGGARLYGGYVTGT